MPIMATTFGFTTALTAQHTESCKLHKLEAAAATAAAAAAAAASAAAVGTCDGTPLTLLWRQLLTASQTLSCHN